MIVGGGEGKGAYERKIPVSPDTERHEGIFAEAFPADETEDKCYA